MNTTVLRGAAAAILGLAVVGTTGAVIAARAQATKTVRPAPSGKVSPWEAIKIATGKVPGHALNANFEFEDGHWIYGVIVVSGKTLKEVEIDAASGKVGDTETITPSGEAKEVQAELTAAVGGKAPKATAEKDEKGERE